MTWTTPLEHSTSVLTTFASLIITSSSSTVTLTLPPWAVFVAFAMNQEPSRSGYMSGASIAASSCDREATRCAVRAHARGSALTVHRGSEIAQL